MKKGLFCWLLCAVFTLYGSLGIMEEIDSEKEPVDVLIEEVALDEAFDDAFELAFDFDGDTFDVFDEDSFVIEAEDEDDDAFTEFFEELEMEEDTFEEEDALTDEEQTLTEDATEDTAETEEETELADEAATEMGEFESRAAAEMPLKMVTALDALQEKGILVAGNGWTYGEGYNVPENGILQFYINNRELEESQKLENCTIIWVSGNKSLRDAFSFIHDEYDSWALYFDPKVTTEGEATYRIYAETSEGISSKELTVQFKHVSSDVLAEVKAPIIYRDLGHGYDCGDNIRIKNINVHLNSNNDYSSEPDDYGYVQYRTEILYSEAGDPYDPYYTDSMLVGPYYNSQDPWIFPTRRFIALVHIKVPYRFVTSNGSTVELYKELQFYFIAGNTVGELVFEKPVINVALGESFKVKVKTKPTGVKIDSNKLVVWYETSNWNIADTDDCDDGVSGIIYGNKRGSTTLTAELWVRSNAYGYEGYHNTGIKATCKVNVVSAKKATSVKLNKTKLTMNPGKTKTLKLTVKPKNAYIKTVKWKSSNKKVATVNSSGKITAKKAGQTTITATVTTAKNIKKTAQCVVTVKNKPVKSVTLNNKKATLTVGEKLTLTTKIKPSNATNQKVIWKSSNKKVATVNKNGVVTAKKKGKTKITVTTKDGKKSKTCVITVKNAPEPTSTPAPETTPEP